MASLSLQNAYHLYLQSYAHTLPGIPEQQRKAESRDTTRMLAKLNSNSPTYVSASALASKDSALHLKKITLNLEQSIDPFHKSEDSDHTPEQSAYSLDESIADVQYAPEYSTNPAESFSLEVKNIAKEQINTGLPLSDSSQALTTGTYSFLLSFQHMNYEFQFDVNPSDTNLSVGEKVCNMIKNAHIGIDASLHSTKHGSSFMELRTLQTGIDADQDVIFTLTDKTTPGVTGFIKHFGLDYVSQFPQNSNILIDDHPISTQSNKITLTNGFLLNLKKPSNGAVAIGLKTDADTIAENIEKYISSYNHSLQELIDFDPPSSNLSVLAEKLANTPRSLEDSLEPLGITLLDNKLQFDPSVFRSNLDTAEKDGLTKDFIKPLYQLSNRISDTLKKAILDPITYTNSVIASYKNITKSNYASPYASSAYAGMYFNAYR